MHPPEEEKFSGAALMVEGGIIALLASNILKLTTGWQLDFVFNLALATLMILYLIRAASTFVDDANMARIRLTTPLSSICLQFCIIGAVANSAIYLSKFDGGLKPLFQQPVLKFTLFSIDRNINFTGGSVISQRWTKNLHRSSFHHVSDVLNVSVSPVIRR